MAKKPIRVGIIGIGGIGLTHARAVTRQAGMEFCAFLDASPQMMARAAKMFPDAVACNNLDEFISANVGAAIIATPNNLHAEFTIACAKAGMHVFCEKPISMTVKEGMAMCKALKKARRIGFTNFSYRWFNSFDLLRDMIRKGEMGGINRVHVKYLQSFLMDREAPLRWRNVKETAGYGALGDLGSHMVDTVRFLTGAEPKRAIGVSNIHVKTKPHPVTGKPAKVTTDSGAQFMVDFGRFTGIFETSQVEPGHGNHLEVSLGTDNGSVKICAETPDEMELAIGAPSATEVTWQTCLPKVVVPTSKRKIMERGQPCIDSFHRAITRQTKDYPRLEDGLAAQRVLEAIAKSAKSNRWEKV